MTLNTHANTDSRPSDAQRRAGERQAGAFLRIIRDVDQAVRAGQPADAALGRLFRQNRRFGSRDRRFITNTIFSYYRWKGWVETPSDPPFATSCVYAHLLDDPVVLPAIKVLAEQAGIPDEGLTPLADRPLAEKGRLISAVMNREQPCPIDALVPSWVQSQLETIEDPDHFARCVASFQIRPPVWIRVRKHERDDVIRHLHEHGHTAHRHPLLSEALRLDAAVSRTLARASDQPYFEIQDLASQCVGAVCDAHPNEEWWDVCAGAGGKSLHLADRMQEQGVILATDSRAGALRELEMRAQRMNTRMITPLRIDANKPFPIDALFDGVLVDAPCTGLGTWPRNPDARWRLREEDMKEKALLQSELLRRAAAHVKPGGTLVYAACTLTRKETTGVIRDFLNGHTDVSLDPFPHPLNGHETDGTLFIRPWEGPCDGMFVARFERG